MATFIAHNLSVMLIRNRAGLLHFDAHGAPFRVPEVRLRRQLGLKL